MNLANVNILRKTNYFIVPTCLTDTKVRDHIGRCTHLSWVC